MRFHLEYKDEKQDERAKFLLYSMKVRESKYSYIPKESQNVHTSRKFLMTQNVI